MKCWKYTLVECEEHHYIKIEFWDIEVEGKVFEIEGG